jgi:NADH-quinone oxidoreductase subunit L
VLLGEQGGAPTSSTPNGPFEEQAMAGGHARHSPITLTAALTVAALAALSVLGALLLLGLRGAIHVGVLSAVLSVLLIAGAALGVFTMSRSGVRDAADVLPLRVRESAVRGFGADAAYAAFGRAVVTVARLVVVLDRDVIDAYPRAAAATSLALGRAGERTHRAVPSPALIGLVMGVIVVAVLGVTAWR